MALQVAMQSNRKLSMVLPMQVISRQAEFLKDSIRSAANTSISTNPLVRTRFIIGDFCPMCSSMHSFQRRLVHGAPTSFLFPVCPAESPSGDSPGDSFLTFEPGRGFTHLPAGGIAAIMAIFLHFWALCLQRCGFLQSRWF